jgi:hypothetical protein
MRHGPAPPMRTAGQSPALGRPDLSPEHPASLRTVETRWRSQQPAHPREGSGRRPCGPAILHRPSSPGSLGVRTTGREAGWRVVCRLSSQLIDSPSECRSAPSQADRFCRNRPGRGLLGRPAWDEPPALASRAHDPLASRTRPGDRLGNTSGWHRGTHAARCARTTPWNSRLRDPIQSGLIERLRMGSRSGRSRERLAVLSSPNPRARAEGVTTWMPIVLTVVCLVPAVS